MKSFSVFAASLVIGLSASTSFAGAYGLDCSSKDKSIVIRQGEVTVRPVTGPAIENAPYYADTGAQLMMSSSLQEYLKEKGTKVVIERPEFLGNSANPVKQISMHHFRDECKNAGQSRKFKETLRVLDNDGNELVSALVVCEERQISGHCF